MENEKRNRIRVSLAAYGYEIADRAIMSDGEFDELSKRINPMIFTDNIVLDVFFMGKFNVHTGIWIHEHPELPKLAKLFDRLQSTGIYEKMAL